MLCKLCNKDKKLYAHHLKYKPEIIVYLCNKCHHAIHWMNDMQFTQKAITWIIKYGNCWKDGRRKTNNTKRAKQQRHDWYIQNLDKMKKYHRSYYINHKKIKESL